MVRERSSHLSFLPSFPIAQRHTMEETACRMQMGFTTPAEGRKEGTLSATQTLRLRRHRGQREHAAPYRLQRWAPRALPRALPAVLTVLLTRVPVHGPDVQPRRGLPSQWLWLPGFEGPHLAPPRTSGPLSSNLNTTEGNMGKERVHQSGCSVPGPQRSQGSCPQGLLHARLMLGALATCVLAQPMGWHFHDAHFPERGVKPSSV